jgi:hypothetical protein
LLDHRRWTKLNLIAAPINDTLRYGKVMVVVLYSLPSKPMSARRFAAGACVHWGLRNRVHGESAAARVSRGQADGSLRTLRRTALSLVKNNAAKQLGVKNERITANCNDDY